MSLFKNYIQRAYASKIIQTSLIGILFCFFFYHLTAKTTDTTKYWKLLTEVKATTYQKNYSETIKKLDLYLKSPLENNSFSILKLQLEYGKAFKIIGDYPKCLSSLLSLESGISANNPFAYAILPDLYHEIGAVYLLLRDIKKSNDYSLKSIKYRKKFFGSKAPALFKTYTNMGTIYQELGQISRALENYNLALNIKLSQKTEPDMQLSMIYQNMGRLYYLKDMFDSSLYYYKESQNIVEKILTDSDHQLGVFYSNFGVLHKSMGNYEEALTYYKQAEKIFINVFGPDDLLLYVIYSNIGNIYRILGDYAHALQYYQNSLVLIENDGKSKYEKQYSIYINMAGLFISYGYYEDAIEYLERCFNLKEEYLADYDLELPYNNMAVCYSNLDNPEKALIYFKKQIEQAKYSGSESAELANAYMSYGIFCLETNNRPEALEKLSLANKIYRKLYGLKHPFLAQSSLSLADYYLNTDINKSLKLLQLALTQILPDFNSMELSKNPNIDGIFSDLNFLKILQKKATALFISAQGESVEKLELSLSTLELANKLSQIIQVSYMNEESKLFISSNQKSFTVLSAQIAIQLYRLTSEQSYLDKVFSIAEKSKAAILLSSLQDFDAKSISNIPDDLSDQEYETGKQLSVYRELIYKENQKEDPDKKMISQWQRKVFELTHQQEDMIAIYKKKYPDYFNLRYQFSVLSLETIQSKLNKDEAIIEYVLGDTIAIALLITQQSISAEIIPIDDQFFRLIDLIRNNLMSTDFGNKVYDNYIDYVNSASVIYKDFVDIFLSGKNIERLIIIPDDVLFYIPFEILLTSKPEKMDLDYRKLNYLIRKYNISYSYSATLSYTDFKRKRKTSKKLLAMAPQYGNYSSLNPERAANIQEYQDYLVDLPGVKEEISQVTKRVRGRSYSGAEATEALFKQIASNYGVLHLAMHTILNNENPMFSKLVFYLNNDAHEDGMLNTYELYNMNINAKLAVLSACNTGSGTLQKGEGVMSLARGFIMAGCPSIIMTLWALEDKSGLKIMTSFYKLFSKGKSSDYALWQAKLEYLENADKLKSHPYFWSGYVMIGNPVSMKKNTAYYLLGLLFLLITAGIVIFRTKKKVS